MCVCVCVCVCVCGVPLTGLAMILLPHHTIYIHTNQSNGGLLEAQSCPASWLLVLQRQPGLSPVLESFCPPGHNHKVSHLEATT